MSYLPGKARFDDFLGGRELEGASPPVYKFVKIKSGGRAEVDRYTEKKECLCTEVLGIKMVTGELTSSW